MKSKTNIPLGHHLARTHRAMHFLFKRHLEEKSLEITPEQWSTLVNLWEKDGQTQMELAVKCSKDKTSIVRILDNLERNSMIVRIPNPSDKRSKLIYLTNRAKELEKISKTIARGLEKEAIKGIPEEEMKTCRDVLSKIYDNLEAANKQNRCNSNE